MLLSRADSTRASGPLRAYRGAGHDEDRNEAHAILTDLILDATTPGDQEAFGALDEARLLLSLGHYQANGADNMLDTLERTRRE